LLFAVQQLKRVLADAETRYRVALESAREELGRGHAVERASLMAQLHQLEGRLGRVLQEREQERGLLEKGERKGGCGQCGGGDWTEVMETRVQQVLEQWRVNLAGSVSHLVRRRCVCVCVNVTTCSLEEPRTMGAKLMEFCFHVLHASCHVCPYMHAAQLF